MMFQKLICQTTDTLKGLVRVRAGSQHSSFNRRNTLRTRTVPRKTLPKSSISVRSADIRNLFARTCNCKLLKPTYDHEVLREIAARTPHTNWVDRVPREAPAAVPELTCHLDRGTCCEELCRPFLSQRTEQRRGTVKPRLPGNLLVHDGQGSANYTLQAKSCL